MLDLHYLCLHILWRYVSIEEKSYVYTQHTNTLFNLLFCHLFSHMRVNRFAPSSDVV